MSKLTRFFTTWIGLGLVCTVRAATPVWGLDEVYSNPDRSVQFVVHATPESGQQYLRGLELVVYGEEMTRRFTFPRDLPGDSAGHSFLIATQGFADLKVLQPDYVVPNGFFPVSGGCISVAGHTYCYPAVPTDGVNAYWQTPDSFSWTSVAVGINFAGERYKFDQAPPSPPAFAIGPAITGAWYDPAQSGHGLFIEVLSENRFYASWFAFDPAGTQQAWFTGVGTYSGNTASVTAVEMPTGGRWIPNFDPSQIVRNAWGTLTFTFTDCDHGRVDFNSVAEYGTGSMSLTRLTQPAGLTCP